MAENVKEDNINSLCKKYFTPELCEDCVTESKSTLEKKLWVQLEKYGKKISQKYHSVTDEDIEDVLIQTISDCFKNWRKGTPSTSYSAYYSASLRNNFMGENIRSKKQGMELCLDAPIDESDSPTSTIGDTIGDESANFTDIVETSFDAKKQFKFIDKCFRAKKGKDWWKSILTCYFYEDLHKLADSCPDTSLDRYSFIDMNIYNWNETPTQKKVAEYLGKDEGQMSTKLKVFINFVKEQYESKGVNL